MSCVHIKTELALDSTLYSRAAWKGTHGDSGVRDAHPQVTWA